MQMLAQLMSTENSPGGDGDSVALPQDDFSETLLIAELEPSSSGDERAILYPKDRPAKEIATQWVAASADVLISLERVR
jgi:hypothetical protein